MASYISCQVQESHSLSGEEQGAVSSLGRVLMHVCQWDHRMSSQSSVPTDFHYCLAPVDPLAGDREDHPREKS